ncbi:uncharacterized protein PAC_00880 [Phialocephala subalpina]|uniref:Nucleolar protein Dnt1-like N-terminal domain-containing protein n=1 Tax=Phialocephala subalpina TaxID=576137 RepID=A0A1L7WDZ7_9HELO|nr:uncharacterized protein PAC_00880 [Phialocephala subalpina]
MNNSEMTTSMRPPMLPSYSLRVQLFLPNAHSSTDKPIRQFRVVTSPDVTVRDFCQEASRIHEINYGEPLAVKKVQDDEGFDITQSEILGSLFASTSIIRIVQASATPSIRDSVPPTSALRFDPSTSRKRGREGSARPDGNVSSNSYKPNKRQRVVNPDPDEPLPSREDESEVAGPSRDNRRTSRENIIPDSQESLGAQKVFNSRQVRQDLPMIPETPSPSPPPEAHPADKKHHLTDAQTQKPIETSENNDSSFLSNADNSSPLREASVRAQLQIQNSRAKSASYHIQRVTERGTSVSTAATSPLSLDQRSNLENGGTSSSKRKRPSPKPILPTQNGNRFRSQNEQSLYENILSEDEGSAVSRKKKEAAKSRDSPRPGPPSTEQANGNFNTSANGSRRTPAPREQANAPGELPLTPSSEERKKQQKKEADEAKKARLAAAEAAEKRKREAEEARQAEEARTAEEQRHQREEQERLDVKAVNQAEAERRRKAIIQKAARLQREREERETREAEEARRNGESRIAREETAERRRREQSRAAREKAAKEARIAKEKQAEEERLAEEKSAAEAERLREEEERVKREKQEAAAEEQRKAGAEAQKAARRSSAASERSRHSKSASPALLKNTPIPTPKPQSSSTSFFPNGRKPSLKHSLSSQALKSSSPAGSKPSPDGVSPGVGIEDQLPLPNKLNRKVSFNEETITPQKETPIPPPRRILPPKAATPKPVVQKETVQKKAIPKESTPTPKESTPKPPASKGSLFPPGKESNTPIPVPKTLSRSSQERSGTPTAQTKVSPPLKITPRTSSKLLVANQTLKKYGRAAAASQKKEKSKPIEQPEAEESSDDESEENLSSKAFTKKLSPHPEVPTEVVSSNTTIKFEPREARDEDGEVDMAEDENEDEDDDANIDEDETQSQTSSQRESSRSPITFTQQPQMDNTPKPQRAASPEVNSSSEEEEDEEEESDSSDSEDAEKDYKAEAITNDDAASSKSDEDEDSEQSESKEDKDEDEEGPEVQVPKSSPELPPHKPTIKPTLVKPGIKPTLAPSSSVPTPIPASSNATTTKPRIGFGASLSSLNKASAALAASSQAKVNGARSSSQKLQLQQEDENSEEESEEESEEDDDSSADEEEEVPQGKKPTLTTSKTAFRVEDTQKDSDASDSGSESDGSDDEEEEEKQRLGRELMSQVNAMNGSGGSQDSIPSPKMYRSGTQDTPKAKKAPEKKKSNSLLTGYVFSPPA